MRKKASDVKAKQPVASYNRLNATQLPCPNVRKNISGSMGEESEEQSK